MAQSVIYEVEKGVAIIGVDNPPLNALTASVRLELIGALDRALADPGVAAILFYGEGRGFPPGRDVGEFVRPQSRPQMSELCARVEAAAKPVVAAMHGTVSGEGFELAMAAHYRVALTSARFGLPEVTLGLLPAAGGTQRAPRLVGADLALELMLGGRPVRADAPKASGFVDRLVEDGLRDAALEFAGELAGRGGAVRRSSETGAGMAEPMAFQQAIAKHRQAIATRPEIALGEIVNCVEAAGLLPFEQGLAFERAAFETCLSSDQSAALRHAFFGERRAARFPEMKTGSAREIGHVGIVGGGGVGGSIAMACLSAGLAVTVFEEDAAALGAALERIDAILERAVRRGLITARRQKRLRDLLRGESDPERLVGVDLVIEAMAGDRPASPELGARLDAAIARGALCAGASPRSDIAALAARHPAHSGAVLGLYFRFPAHATRLVEIALGENTDADSVASAVAFVRKLGKVPVRRGVGAAGDDGASIGDQMMAAYLHAADRMLEEGATPYLIDAAMEAYGMASGPYRARDMIGLDAASQERGVGDSEGDGAGSGSGSGSGAGVGLGQAAAGRVEIADRLREAGRLGRRSGRGYYRYEKGSAQAEQDPEVIALIRAERERKGLTARGFKAEEIQRRCLLAMVNQGARLLRRRIVQRPSDIDMVMLHGYGFPRWRGGPMMAADLAGLLHLKKDLEAYAQVEPGFWSPEPILDELIKNGQGFASLNR